MDSPTGGYRDGNCARDGTNFDEVRGISLVAVTVEKNSLTAVSGDLA